MINKEEFRQQVLKAGNTGQLINLPADMSELEAGQIMAEVAAHFLNTGQDIKAIIILNERQRLRV